MFIKYVLNTTFGKAFGKVYSVIAFNLLGDKQKSLGQKTVVGFLLKNQHGVQEMGSICSAGFKTKPIMLFAKGKCNSGLV